MASIAGLYTGEDVSIGNILLNAVSEDNCAWVITDLDGWWGLPNVESPDNPKSYLEDGSYYTSGRFLVRDIFLKGHILPMDGQANSAVAARNTFNRALSLLVRGRTLLRVAEDPTKVAMVQLAGKPLTKINRTTGYLEFDIPLRAVDPVKYGEFLKMVETGIGQSTLGRTYNKEFFYSYGGASSNGIAQVNNLGSYRTDALMTITGPVTNPKIEHIEQNKFLELDIVLGINEKITLNTKTNKIVIGNVNRRNALVVGSQWFDLNAGINNIRYTGFQHIAPRKGYTLDTNLAVNPKAVPTNSTLTSQPVLTNRFTNPSFETPTDQQPEVRRNLVLNPSAESSTFDYITSKGISLQERHIDTTEYVFGERSFKIVLPDGGTPSQAFSIDPTASFEYAETVRWSMYVKTSEQIDFIPTWYTEDGILSGGIVEDQTTVYGETWTRISGSLSIPESLHLKAGLAFGFVALNEVEEDGFVHIDGVLVERGTAPVQEYFDGSLSSDIDLTPVWLGEEHLSSSALLGIEVKDVGLDATGEPEDLSPSDVGIDTDGALYFKEGGDSIFLDTDERPYFVLGGSSVFLDTDGRPYAEATTDVPFELTRAVIQSSIWATRAGRKSVRVIPISSKPSVSGAVIYLQGTEVGKTYTVSATMHLEAPLTGELHGMSRRIVVGNVNSPSAIFSEQAPNTGGNHTVSLTFEAQSTTTEVHLTNGATAGNGDVWWDDFMWIDGRFTGRYFDGNSTPQPGRKYSWAGLENDSVSYLTADRGTSLNWSYSGGTAVSRSVSTTGPKFAGTTAWYSIVSQSTDESSNAGPTYSEPNVFGLPGDVITSSLYVRTSMEVPVRLQMQFRTGTTAHTVIDGPFITLRENVWTRLSVSGVSQEEFDNMVLWAQVESSNALPAGESIEATWALVHAQSEVGEYFDGDSPEADWVGTPNQSESHRPYVSEIPETMLQLAYRDAWIE